MTPVGISSEPTHETSQPWDPAPDRRTRMSRVRLVLMGLRMSVATPESRRRLAVAGVGSSLAMMVLLLGLAMLAAHQAQQERAAARAPLAVERIAENGLRVVSEQTATTGSSSWFKGIEVGTVVAEPAGTPAPPPGLSAFPAPGTIAASPAFAELQATDALFAQRYPGPISEIIGTEGLVGPNEVFAWISVADAATSYPTSGYGPAPEVYPGQSTSDGPDLVVPLGIVLFALPALILVGTSTRLGSTQRDQRMAAMRLLGATPGEVRLVAAADAAVVGAIGAVGGLVLFGVLRLLAGHLPGQPGLYPGDLSPDPMAVLGLLLALPLLGLGAGYVSQRRVVASPLGVTRRAAPRRPRVWRLVPLGVGLGMLLTLALVPGLVNAPNPAPVYVLLIGGAALTLLGLVLAAPLVGHVTASALLRIGRLPVAGTLGARRVQADPNAAARLVTGTTVLVFVATWVLASFVPVLADARTGYLDGPQAQTAPGTLTGVAKLSSVETLRAIPGVRAVVPAVTAEWSSDGDGDPTEGSNAALVDCTALTPMLREPLPDCDEATAYSVWADPSAGKARLIDLIAHRALDLPTTQFGRTGSPSTPEGMNGDLRSALSSLLQASFTVPAANIPADLPEDWGVRMLVATDSSPAAIESVKTVLGADSGLIPLTADESRRVDEGSQREYEALLLAYLAAIALVAAVSLAVAGVDDVRTRRRAMAAQAAAGTPVSTLRRAGLIQLSLTLIPGVALALGAAALAGWMYSELWLVGSESGAPRPFDPGVILAVGVGSVAIVVLAYALTLPAIRSAVDLRGLRTG